MDKPKNHHDRRKKFKNFDDLVDEVREEKEILKDKEEVIKELNRNLELQAERQKEPDELLITKQEFDKIADALEIPKEAKKVIKRKKKSKKSKSKEKDNG